MCTIARYGCPDNAAANYDPAATLEDPSNPFAMCQPKKACCMNPAAKNMYCTGKQDTPCVDSPSAMCNVHNFYLCTYQGELAADTPTPPSPAPPPLPPAPEGQVWKETEVFKVIAKVTLAGSDTYLATNKPGLVTTFNTAAGTSFQSESAYFTSNVDGRIFGEGRRLSQASSTLQMEQTYESLAEAEQAASTTTAVSPAALEAQLVAAGFNGATVLAVENAEAVTVVVMVLGSPDSADEDATGAIIGGIIGGIVVIALLAVVYFKKKQRDTKTATVVPA